MVVDKAQIQQVVTDVMARMFFLLPDVDEHGRHIRTGPAPDNGSTVLLSANEDCTLQFFYQQELMELMTAHLTALPTDEVPLDWIRQIPLEATEACWAQYLTRFDPDSKFPFSTPYIPEKMPDASNPRWQLIYQVESYRLQITCI